ncbi:MAG: protein kinase [Clostridia bacterium]|nr:protein kinase [Clostridia bacterium]
MIGHVISGRYVVQAIVGTGGMAVVYRALDKKKNRIVAIKVLRPEYETDVEFVRRFSREAEAASKVSHENIVNMLDVGIDGDLRYIVMEYVDGITLKEMIRQRGQIHPDTVIRMTIRILAAVDHAHRNGIVHRDIKPQNILVDSQGRVKVADFGIARLKASQTTKVTGEDGASAMGSVHYFSPEQAKGEVADEKSDLYSVGVVMYEMLTGQVPFDGETSVSVALKHVSEEPRSMREHQSGISKALDEVVMRALCKEGSKRYQAAAEMAADLRKTITHPEGGFVRYPLDPEEIEKNREIKKRRYQKNRRRMAYAAAIVSVCLIVFMIISGVWRFVRDYNTYPMPWVLGAELTAAQATMEQLGVSPEIAYAYSEEYAPGYIALQSHKADTRVDYNQTVTLTVSMGSRWYELENFAGTTQDYALERLGALNIESVSVEYVQSDSPVGTVLQVSPEPGMQARDIPVVLTVSGQRVLMPSLAGLTVDGARALIEAEDLVMGAVTEGYSADAKAGAVIAQSVAANAQVMAGTVVDITVNQPQSRLFYPGGRLSVVVPLEGTHAEIVMETPSGAYVEGYTGVLNAGTHRIALSSQEEGKHALHIYMDGVLMETQYIVFE